MVSPPPSELSAYCRRCRRYEWQIIASFQLMESDIHFEWSMNYYYNIFAGDQNNTQFNEFSAQV